MKSATAENEIDKINCSYTTIPLKFGVDRKVNKFEEVPDDLPRISLDMVESETGIIKENNEGSELGTGLVEFQRGNVLFAKLRPYLAKVFEAEFRGAASPEFIVLEPKEFDSRFLHYLCLSNDFIDRVNASTYGAKMPRASWNFIGNLQVPCPNISVQEKIAEYLDQQVGYIQDGIKHLEDLHSLLGEKQNSLISYVITPQDVQDSDNPLTGVPEHWEVIRLKYLLNRLEQGWSPKCNDHPSKRDEWGVLKAGAANNGEFHPNENKALPNDKEPRPELGVSEGDLIMNRASGSADLLGSVAIVPQNTSKLMLCDKLFRLHVRNEVVLSEYLYIVLRSKPLRHQINKEISGAEGLANNIPQSAVKNLKIPIPSRSEQKIIVENISQRENKLDDYLSKTNRLISLLNEKRQSIITKAINGQIDLRTIESTNTQEATYGKNS
ncbi:restriction endonuclease subunit S [Halonotius terrestris]|uniref:Restriction endonuclease subunit S n=1 Tax=Halonotius terrestris TaxID=2487750 RepID=A0A8J8PAX4_9EURY|nr:restriction endonuclease subunit S [Halonotius terrestris]TQQ83035.1 restriction endonuclease subunit S [Halonotius terrestris]